MKKKLTVTFVSLLLIFFMMKPVLGGEIEDNDKTLSPYFLVKSDDPNTDQLPLKSTSARVDIAGVIADVQVTQVYKNEGKNTLEAIYVFPASTRAAVYGMKMTIGKRTIVAKIQEREEARKNYETAKKEGRSASLLEQQRPNVFQMNVANIHPGDKIKVELSYTELLVPSEGVYEFVYPTVVGPRYSETPAAGATPSEKWVQNPYLHEGEAPTYTFDMGVTISAGLPIQKISCDTHKTNIRYKGKTVAMVTLDKSEENGGNRDYILKYQLAGGKIQSGLLLYEGKKENFFLLMVQPPKKVKPMQIPPREYIFIVDISGSMRGYPLEVSKKMVADLISNLKPTDTFNVLLFAGSSAVMSEQGSLPATAENIQQAIRLIENQRGGGGTRILPALERAFALPPTRGGSRTIVPITDGYVNVEPEVFQLIRDKLNEANLFAFGIGTSVNRLLIEGMAHAGMGEPFIVTKRSEAAAQGVKFREYVCSPVLTRIKLNFGKFQVYNVEPPVVPDVLAERPVICFGKWRGKPGGRIELSGYSGEGTYEKSIMVEKVRPLKENAALRYLWARHRIRTLGDFNTLRKDDERVKQMTQLGLKYNLLTHYTSFVAIDSIIRDKKGESKTVKQALPLPMGVPDTAVGDSKRLAFAYFKSVKGLNSTLKLSPNGIERKKKLMKERLALRKHVKVEKIIVKENKNFEPLVKALVTPKLPKLVECINDLASGGTFEIEFKINNLGSVGSLVVNRNEVGKKAEKCFVETIRKWTFEHLHNTDTVTIILTFVLTK